MTRIKMEMQIHHLPQKLQNKEEALIEIGLNTAKEIGLQAESCNFIFVDDRHLSDMHEQYLQDPSKTDVITFNLGEDKIEGEIYISAERAVEQAREYSVSLEEEIIRLFIHGLLHLKGYNDKTESERAEMKTIENTLVEKYAAPFKKK